MELDSIERTSEEESLKFSKNTLHENKIRNPWRDQVLTYEYVAQERGR